MKILYWNCRVEGSKWFIRVAKEYIRVQNPDISVIVEPRISGERANEVCKKFGDFNVVRVET